MTRSSTAQLGIAASCAFAMALAGGAAAPEDATAAALVHHHRVQSVTCVSAPSSTVRAKVVVRMSVVNYAGWNDWADHLKAQARLEPTTTGLNFTRSWATWKSPYLLQNHRYVFTPTLTTDNVSGTGSWKLHVKLVWQRTFPTKDITVHKYFTFDPSCTVPGSPGET